MKRKVSIYASGVILALAAVYLISGFFSFPGTIYENLSFAFSPSAERAYEYGETHFNAQRSKEYDLDRAEYFFRKAEKLDPTLLYVHHELARIAFLRGMFETAMAQINLQISMHGDRTPNSYYIRGLIEGYMGNYSDSARDYEHYLQVDPHNWAALNDYAWVLLKAQRFSDAVSVTTRGLADFPDNPWLLNSQATALFELHKYTDALAAAEKASASVASLSETDWLRAYPGNDPQTGAKGLSTFKKAVADNLRVIQSRIASSTNP